MIDVTLGIDIGTSGARIAARGIDGSLLALSEVSLNLPVQSGTTVNSSYPII